MQFHAILRDDEDGVSRSLGTPTLTRLLEVGGLCAVVTICLDLLITVVGEKIDILTRFQST
jgi:hypothetical protein